MPTHPPPNSADLPPPPDTRGMWVAGEAAERQEAFFKECERLWQEAATEVGVDPTASTPEKTIMLRVVSDPWADSTKLPKRYRQEPKKVPTPADLIGGKVRRTAV